MTEKKMFFFSSRILGVKKIEVGAKSPALELELAGFYSLLCHLLASKLEKLLNSSECQSSSLWIEDYTTTLWRCWQG